MSRQSFAMQEVAHYFFCVAVLAVYGVIQLPHVVVGNFSGEGVEGRFDLRMAGKDFTAHDRNCLVGWKVVPVVVEDEEVEGGNEAVGGVAGGEVDLTVFEGAGEQAEVHDARRFGETQAVGRGESPVAVGALHEFVSETGTPGGGVLGGL